MVISCDCRNIGIPSDAVVTDVQVRWIVTGGYIHMNLALFEENGSGYYIPSNDLVSHDFAGKPAAQVWSSQFYVDSIEGFSVKVEPQLMIYYK